MGLVAALLLLVAQEGDVATWVGELGSEDFKTREAATAKLIGAGIAALERLEAVSGSGDAEVRSRVDAIVKEILRRHVEAYGDPRRSTPVRLDLKDISIQGALEAFRKQVPLTIEFDDRNVPDDFRVEAFAASGIAFRPALDGFCEKAELRVVHETADRLRISRPPRLTFVFRKVDVKVIFRMIHSLTDVRVEAPEDLQGTVTITAENEPWSDLLDRVATEVDSVAYPLGEGRMAVRPAARFREEMTMRSFPLKHLAPARPAAGKSDPWAELLLRTGLILTRGASWKTVHGKMEFDLKTRTLRVTDRKEVLEAVRELVEKTDR